MQYVNNIYRQVQGEKHYLYNLYAEQRRVFSSGDL